MRPNYNSRYKIHSQELSAKDVMQKKKEKILSNVEENENNYNNDLKVKNKNLVSVSNYNTYNAITKPKFHNAFSSEKLSGHNIFKYINENGKLSDKNRTLTSNNTCATSSVQEEVFLNDTFDEMTNYLDENDTQLIIDMINNEYIENERSKVVFSITFNDLTMDDINDDFTNDIIDLIYTGIISGITTIEKSRIKISDIQLGSVIINFRIITDEFSESQKIRYSLWNIDLNELGYSNAFFSDIEIFENGETIISARANDINIFIDEDSSYNIDLSTNYVTSNTISFYITSLPVNGTLYTINSTRDIFTEITDTTSPFDNNQIIYVPNSNYYGSDSFLYRIEILSEYLISPSAKVDIVINNINDDPSTIDVSINGIFKQGETLYANVTINDVDNLDGNTSDISYQWKYSNAEYGTYMNIGATDSSFTISDDKTYVNSFIKLFITATDNAGYISTHESSATEVQNKNNLPSYDIEIVRHSDNTVIASFDVENQPVQDETLDISFTIVDNDISTNSFNQATIQHFAIDASFSYQWYRGSSIINGATDPSYTLQASDIYSKIYVNITYYDGYVTETVDSSYTGNVQSNGNNPINFTPSYEFHQVYIDTSNTYNFNAVNDQYNDYSDITYRIFAKNEHDVWSTNHFNDSIVYELWEFDSSNRNLVVKAGYDTYLDQSNNWSTPYIELRVEAYSQSATDISDIYTFRFEILQLTYPFWIDPPLSINDISENSYFTFDISINELSYNSVDLIVSHHQLPSWVTYSYTHPYVSVSGSPEENDVGNHTIELYIDVSGSNIPYIILGPYNFAVLNVNNMPDISNIEIVINNVVIVPNTDISQGSILDISFTISDADVSSNPFNNNTIHNFLDNSSFSYQWYSDNSLINGETSSSYTLTQSDVSSEIFVTITYIDKYSNQTEISSNVYGPVTNINDSPSGSITFFVNGTELSSTSFILQEDDHIEASLNDVVDIDVINYSTITYQWYRDSFAISNAVDFSYTLTQQDVGCIIKLNVSYDDQFGHPEDISGIVSDISVNNLNDPLSLTIDVSYSGPLMVYNELTVTITSVYDDDGISSYTYEWYKGLLSSENTSWYIIDYLTVSNTTDLSTSIVLDASMASYYLRVRVSVTDQHNDTSYVDYDLSGAVSEWSISSSSYFFSRSGRVVNSSIAYCDICATTLLTGLNVLDHNGPSQTDASGLIDLSFSIESDYDKLIIEYSGNTITDFSYTMINYTDFLILAEFKNGEVYVDAEDLDGNLGESCINNIIFYKIFRVVDQSGNRDISDSNTNSLLPDAYTAIDSACNAKVFDLKYGEFYNYFDQYSVSGFDVTFQKENMNPLTNDLSNIPLVFEENSTLDITTLVRDHFGNASIDYINSMCADFVLEKINDQKTKVAYALALTDISLNTNPYDQDKIEALHTITTAISRVILTRNIENFESMLLSDKYYPNLTKKVYNSLIDNLPTINIPTDGFLMNKDMVTQYVDDVLTDISNIHHPLYDEPYFDETNNTDSVWQTMYASSSQEITAFNSNIVDSKSLLKDIAREMVDSTFDLYFDSQHYGLTIQKSRSLMSCVNLTAKAGIQTSSTLENIADDLFTIRGFDIPSDIYVPEIFTEMYMLDDSKSIHLYSIDNNVAYSLLSWELSRDISWNDKDDYPSITQYVNQAVKSSSSGSFSYTFKTSENQDDSIAFTFHDNTDICGIIVTSNYSVFNAFDCDYYLSPTVIFPYLSHEYFVKIRIYKYEHSPSSWNYIDSIKYLFVIPSDDPAADDDDLVVDDDDLVVDTGDGFAWPEP